MGYIYLRTNKINGKCYVGQAKDIKTRNGDWKNLKKRYGGHAIENARKKYGADGFSFELLKECPNDDMNYWEKYYIKMYNSKKPYGYNSTDGGDSTYERSDETRKKISAAHRGKKISPEHIEKMAAANRGKKRTEEVKKKISAALRGRKLSPEHIAKLAAAQRGKPKPKVSAAQRGKKRPAEVGAKISAALKGKPNPKVAAAHRGMKYSEETKLKISASNRGKKRSEETKAKIAAAHRGMKQSPEHIAKKAAALSKAVQALDKEGNVVYEFPSTMEAGRQGFNAGVVSVCCRNCYNRPGNNIYKGLIWRFAS